VGQDGRDEDMQDADMRTWAPLTQAAEAYGVSVDTIRRRIKRKELDTRREMTPQGFRWLVPLPDPAKSSKSTDSPSEALGSPRSEVTPVYGPHIMQMPDPATVELVATLKQDLDARVEEIARLHEIIATQAETIARITTPPVSQEAPPTAGEQEQAPSWLARLRAFFAG